MSPYNLEISPIAIHVHGASTAMITVSDCTEKRTPSGTRGLRFSEVIFVKLDTVFMTRAVYDTGRYTYRATDISHGHMSE